jgi:hypothetical protein
MQGRCNRGDACARPRCVCEHATQTRGCMPSFFIFLFFYLIFCSWWQVCATRREWEQGSSFLWQSRAMGVFTAGVLEAVGRYSRQAQPQYRVPDVKSVMH